MRCSVRCLVFCLFVAVEYLLPERNRQIEKERESMRVCVCFVIGRLCEDFAEEEGVGGVCRDSSRKELFV